MPFEEEDREKLDTIFKILTEGQFKPMSEQGGSANLSQRLAQEGIDPNLLEITQNEDYVMPDGWLGDLWDNINKVLENFGYTWVSKGKESHWKRSETPQEQKDQPKEKDPWSQPRKDDPWTPFKTGNGEWTFAKDRQGNLHKEFANLYERIVEAGKPVVVGSYRYRISGDNDEFLQRFPKDSR